MLCGWLSKSIPREVLNLFIFSSNNRDVTLAEILCEATDEVALETKSENLGKKLCSETASSSIFWKEKMSLVVWCAQAEDCLSLNHCEGSLCYGWSEAALIMTGTKRIISVLVLSVPRTADTLRCCCHSQNQISCSWDWQNCHWHPPLCCCYSQNQSCSSWDWQNCHWDPSLCHCHA